MASRSRIDPRSRCTASTSSSCISRAWDTAGRAWSDSISTRPCSSSISFWRASVASLICRKPFPARRCICISIWNCGSTRPVRSILLPTSVSTAWDQSVTSTPRSTSSSATQSNRACQRWAGSVLSSRASISSWRASRRLRAADSALTRSGAASGSRSSCCCRRAKASASWRRRAARSPCGIDCSRQKVSRASRPISRFRSTTAW